MDIKQWNKMSVEERLQEILKHVSEAFKSYVK